MTKLRAFLSRALMLFHRSQIETELDEEIRSHLEMEADDHCRNGMSPDQARRAALRDFGGIDQTKEQYRDHYRFQLLEPLLQDVRFGLRTLRKNPGFTAVVIVTLALGIGANTAIFSVVNGVLLRPLPYENPDRIVRIIQNRPPDSAPDNVPLRMEGISRDDLQQWRTRTGTFSQMAAYSRTQLALVENGESTRVSAAMMSSGMFRLLGVQPLLGRVFEAGEERADSDAVVILSYAAWRKYLAGDPNILNRRLSLEGRECTVVGVMSQEFSFPDRETEFWVPLVLNPIVRTPDQRTIEFVQTLARLTDGVSMEAATGEANAVFVGFRKEENRFFAEHPGPGGIPLTPPTPFGADERIRIELISLKDELVAPVRPALIVLLVAVGLVLLIACANVANLLLARAATRELEIAIRTALGAGRTRLVGQVLTESVMLAVFGGMLGTIVAVGGIQLLRTIDAGSLPRIEEIRMDLPVFTFTLAVSILTGMLFGCAPAFRLLRADHLHTIKEGAAAGSSRSGLFGRNRTRSFLAVAEITMAMILLTGAGLLINSFLRLSNIDRGYNPRNLLTFRLSSPQYGFRGMVDLAVSEQVLTRLQELPEVRFVALTNVMPMLQGGVPNGPVFIEGRPKPTKPEDIIRVDVRGVSDDFLSALGMRLSEGRSFEDGDRAGQPAVILVNRTLARSYFRNENAIGKRLLLWRGPSPPSAEIVGVVDDVQYVGLDAKPGPEIYLNLQQAGSIVPPMPPPPGVTPGAFPRGMSPLGPMVFAVRTAGDPLALITRIRSIVGEVHSQLIMDDIATMEQRLSVHVVRPRFNAVLLGIFSIIAVVLAAIGIYGQIAYSVSQRTREIGIRIAMGAEPREVLLLVLRQGLVLIAIGIIGGLLGALALTRYLETLLFGLTPTDPMTFVAAFGVIAFVAVFAAFAPAWRVTKVDPVIALRYE